MCILLTYGKSFVGGHIVKYDDLLSTPTCSRTLTPQGKMEFHYAGEGTVIQLGHLSRPNPRLGEF